MRAKRHQAASLYVKRVSRTPFFSYRIYNISYYNKESVRLGLVLALGLGLG